jgi:protein involved in polysaccharide export with SLBB domain
MKNAPYAEPLVSTNTQDPAAVAARQRLQTILDQLNPAGGIVDQGSGSGRHASNEKRMTKKTDKKKTKTGAGSPTESETVNAPDQ